jgi:chemotaxis signal transduction protein
MMASAIESSKARSIVEGSALVCTVGRARIAIPAEAVSRIVEYDLASPLPLAKSLVGGLGVCDGRLLISLSLSSREDDAIEPRRRRRGVLLNSSQPSGLDWAIEVLEVGAFAIVRRRPREISEKPHLPRWVSFGHTSDGHPLGWLDITTMIDELRGHDGLGA